MPIISIDTKYLKDKFDLDLEIEDLPKIKAELDSIDGNIWKIEVKDTERIDLWSVFGIARELKGIKGIEEGLPDYKIKEGNYVLYNYSRNRPYVAAAVVRNVSMDKETLKYIIQMQETLAKNYGRDRKYVAIGIHNFKMIKFPLYYKEVDPNTKFVPLGYNKELTLKEILETEKGKKYKHLVKYYEVLMDSEGKILSFPPIINSNTVGRIREDTTDLFIDVTGIDERRVHRTLNAIVANLLEIAEYAETVKIIKNNEEKVYKIEKRTMEVNWKDIEDWLGIKVEPELLRKARYDIDGNKVSWLTYRFDIYDFTDIAEDYMIIKGYDYLPYQEYKSHGQFNKTIQLYNDIRKLLLGLGATEVYTIALTDKGIIPIKNPVSSNYSYLRDSLIHPLLKFLANNQYKAPIEIFEFGRIYREKPYWSIVYLSLSEDSDYNKAASKLAFLLKELGINYEIKEGKHKYFLEGRTAEFVNDKFKAYAGEIDPNVLEKYGIVFPVSGFEIIMENLNL